MHLNSIRWQLPLSYAAIALLSTLALGIMLLTTLRGHFSQREQDYLYNNANAITSVIAEMISEDVPIEMIQAQVASYSFLSQVRIRILDETGELLVDSGVPDGRNLLSISAEQQRIESSPLIVTPVPTIPPSETDPYYTNLAPEDYLDYRSFQASIEMPINIFVNFDDSKSGETTEYYTPVITLNFIPNIAENNEVSNDEFTSVLPAIGTVFGFGLSEEIDGNGGRSHQLVSQELVNANDEQLGTLILSEGPASGRQIVQRVANGLALASFLAIAIGAIAGWAISRRITVPLSSLTATTTAMADGDLSVRSNLKRGDELGLLAVTFNEMAGRIETTIITLKRFVADAAHELHTPLTALRTSVELMVDETSSDSRDVYMERAQKQIKRLQTLMDNLLDLSRIESGVSRIQYRKFIFNILLQELSEIYASRSEYAGVNFILDLPEQDVSVYGNDGQLRRAIGNLLDNAIKFSPSGASVILMMRHTNSGILIQIEDRGIGIPEEELPLIFSRFHRGRNATSYTGNGLGLAIVKGIVEGHNGVVNVRNSTQGVVFSVMLPLADDAERLMEQQSVYNLNHEKAINKAFS